MARIEDKITAVLTWPRAKSDTKFVQYSLQLHLLERDACLSSDFDRYIRRIQNEINMVEVETLDANWEVEKDQCYVASVDTIYEDGPTFAFSNFLYTAIPPPKKETDLGLILGSVFGSLFFLALVAGLFLFWRRRKRSLDAKCQPKQGVRNKAFTKEADPETFELPQRNSEHEIPTTTFCNVISERVSDVHEKSLKSEFESLKKKSNALARIHDHTSGTKTSKVYGIKGSNMGKDYLVSKSPALQETENLFWKQIMENSVRFIVMLTLHHEHGEVFCSDYLPKDKEPHDFGEIKFKIESKSDGSGYVRREIALQAGNHRQKVTHFQFVNWSKNYCPDISLILNFIRTLRDERAKVENSGSLFVHCSQDFGRTATFIALDKTLQDIEKNKSTLNVFNYVLELRRNLKHLGLLHNERQYIFIHECIMQYLRTPDIYNGYVELEDPANARNNASAAGATTAIDGEPIYADVEITKPDVTAPQMPRPRMGLPPTPNRDSGGHYEVL